VVRARRKQPTPTSGQREGEAGTRSGPLDVNAIVSFNIRELRERRNWTQQYVAQKLSMLTGHELPQASISAMERGFDGERRRRFDAHELYLLALVFDVPITYFFLPPPETGFEELVDSGRPVSELYRTLVGSDWQLAEMDERLTLLKIKNPEEADRAVSLIMGGPDRALRNWHKHYRTWRKERLAALIKEYGDELDDVAAKLGHFADAISRLGPEGYLQSLAHKDDEEVDGNADYMTDEEARKRLAQMHVDQAKAEEG
jgi:transcriptional regulator with XRE-family HTH domain